MNEKGLERCKNCKYAREINSTPGGWKFVGCTRKPYKGKWVAEIKDCPINLGSK
jgi:hypothetical protein